ncbi:hypothetical protein [Thermobrachium celere]|uniref:Uncharacterized protein n=1 Tax=Thermobrachium celere DSM 8682 TaxID=941824 RepID=R7RR92_9CLOT|nr:hypothetical protein [Thermobrachium celere]CDF57780.1 hypothetical protein TCEL_01694 [Thermobrachium celere DSM 8682]
MLIYILTLLLLGFNILICCHFILNSILKSNYSSVLKIDKNNIEDIL